MQSTPGVLAQMQRHSKRMSKPFSNDNGPRRPPLSQFETMFRQTYTPQRRSEGVVEGEEAVEEMKL